MLDVPRPVRRRLLTCTSQARAGLALLALLLATGCARKVTVTSDPPGASVRKNGELVGPTPVDVRVWWVPFWKQEVRLTMSGRRAAVVSLRKNLGLFRAHTVHEVVLIPEHGPAGTWTVEEAKEAN